MRSALTELTPPTSSPERRLSIALVLALTIHALLILGIRLNPLPESDDEAVSSINVTLIKQTGSESTTSPAEPASLPEQAIRPQPPESPPAEEASPVETVEPADSMTRPAESEKSLPEKPAEPTKPNPTMAPQPKTAEPKTSSKNVTNREQEPAVRPEPTIRESAPSPTSAIDIMSKGLQMARSSAQSQPQTGKARERYFNPKAKSTIEDYYVMNWVRKVERVGTLNFPDEARRRNISGSLILDVALRADGSIRDITLIRSSGHKILDDAARDIVELAAPYAPFPEEMRRQYDILHIKRAWQFLQGHRLQSN